MTKGPLPSGGRSERTWRVLRSGDGPGAYNLALDEALFLLAREEKNKPTIRFYGWSPPAVSVGYFQNWDKEIDVAVCRRKGLEVYRRVTGGRAVLHRREVTYSVVCSHGDSLLGEGLLPAYRAIARALCAGLRRLGVEAEMAPPAGKGQARTVTRTASCFSSSAGYEITVDGRKLIGSAQKRQGHALLQHGSILLSSHGEEFAELVRPECRHPGASLSMTSLEDLLGRRPQVSEVVDSLVEGFRQCWAGDIRRGSLGDEESALAHELVRSKYATSEWNGRREKKLQFSI